MSANLSLNLILNSCSLVFFNSFPKIPILFFLCPPITPTNSARNLDIMFDSSLTFSEHTCWFEWVSKYVLEMCLNTCLNHAFYPFVTFVESGTLSTIPLLKPSPSLSFISRSTTATLLIFLAVNLIACNLISTPQLKLFLKPLASAISHPSSNLYSGSKLISTSSIKFSLSLTKHFNLKNLFISTTFSTFKLTLLLVHPLLSLFSIRQSTLVSK